MNERRALRGLPLAGIASAGVVLGHWLAYRVAVPQPRLRADILARSGHAYWLVAVEAVVIAGLAGVGALAARHLSRPLEPDTRPVGTYAWLVARLVPLQMVAFTAMEIVERLAVHAPLAGMFGHHLFVLGLAVQALVAYVGAFVLFLLGRGARLLSEAIHRRRRLALPAPVPVPHTQYVRPLPVLAGASGVRGPPRSS